MIEKVKQILFSDALSDDLKYDLIEQHFINFRSRPDSSNVRLVKWNDETLECVVQFWDRSVYTYYGVPFNDYMALVQKRARATTTGSNRRGRWWVGKPSVGAGIKQILEKYPYRRGGDAS
jgi:hypothetical protein